MSESRVQFGLVATIKSRRVVLPLKAVKCAFSVEGGVAEVTVTQVFLQENRESLDCLYQFPLPADASVYACEAFINDRVIQAKVEEREAARKLVKQKKAEGYRTVMVEEERENLFTLSLGNLQPEDLIEVRLAYIQPLRRLAGSLAVEIPFCPGVRYIPGRPLLRSNRGKGVVDDTDEVPDATRISPVRMAPHDRIMIKLFENSFRDFSEAPMPPAEMLADEAFRQLEGCGATGGTEMGPALSHVLDLIPKHSAGRRTNLVLITDAQVGNERAILGIMQRAQGLAIHCLGIDNALNDALLQALTRQQGGSFHSLNPKDDIISRPKRCILRNLPA